MPFNQAQQDLLQVNAARDRAEQLLKQLREQAEESKLATAARTDLTDEQREQGEHAMQMAIASTERMLESLNDAMTIAQHAVDRGGWEEG